jgi:alkylated DNA repair dioxygenase AlkB
MLFLEVIQKELFENQSFDRPVDIPGFFLRLNYITPQEETLLLEKVETGIWDTEWRRRVQRYGTAYGKDQAISGPFPNWLIPIARRVAEDAGFNRFPDNCVINEYLPGQGIAPHKDYSSFGPKVACLSLGSDVLFDLYSENRKTKRSILVPARSFWVISGDVRSKWLHGIAPRLFDVVHGEKQKRERRVSITFRVKNELEK